MVFCTCDEAVILSNHIFSKNFFSVSDPLHFDADLLPERRIRVRPKIVQIPIFSLFYFYVKGIKLITMYFFIVIYELIIHVYLTKKDFLKKLIFLYF